MIYCCMFKHAYHGFIIFDSEFDAEMQAIIADNHYYTLILYGVFSQASAWCIMSALKK